MEIEVLEGDALALPADVLVLKYAQAMYGVDALVINKLAAAGERVREHLPQPHAFSLVETRGHLGAQQVLFVGVPTLFLFDYGGIREFARTAMAYLATRCATASHVAFTLHGAGYGLDEIEAFRSELAGFLDAIEAGEYPKGLQQITIVERDVRRAQRLEQELERLMPPLAPRSSPGLLTRLLSPAPDALRGSGPETTAPLVRSQVLRTAGAESQTKPHVFVAMPFADEFNDRFHYGIQQAVNAAGYLCERADLSTFTGDVVAWVKERIDSAALLVADLSTANPNVYLEVGYSWGRGIPTVLLAGTEADLRFDVKGQRCLIYKSIRMLEESLTRELTLLRRDA